MIRFLCVQTTLQERLSSEHYEDLVQSEWLSWIERIYTESADVQ